MDDMLSEELPLSARDSPRTSQRARDERAKRRTTIEHLKTAVKATTLYKGNRDDLSVLRGQELMNVCAMAVGEGGVEVKDRRWLMKKFDACFVGAELVDWMVAKLEETPSREKVRLTFLSLFFFPFAERLMAYG